jgi:murein DD-endopeptidase MepM/ murein hydrolase activator NlpD
MDIALPHPIRGHGHRSIVVVVALLALVSLAWPSGAVGAPVAPVPVGVWPLQPTPTVARGFEPPTSTFGAGHRGVDLVGAAGEVVHAALAGRVTFAGRLAGRGVVVVDHGATRTTYEPVTAGVRVGEAVARGQPIGALEVAGSHCLPRACLHWGWKRGSTYLDPLLLVGGGGPIVLLPLSSDTAPASAQTWLPTSSPVPESPLVLLPYADALAALEQGRSVRRSPYGWESGAVPWW